MNRLIILLGPTRVTDAADKCLSLITDRKRSNTWGSHKRVALNQFFDFLGFIADNFSVPDQSIPDEITVLILDRSEIPVWAVKALFSANVVLTIFVQKPPTPLQISHILRFIITPENTVAKTKIRAADFYHFFIHQIPKESGRRQEILFFAAIEALLLWDVINQDMREHLRGMILGVEGYDEDDLLEKLNIYYQKIKGVK